MGDLQVLELITGLILRQLSVIVGTNPIELKDWEDQNLQKCTEWWSTEQCQTWGHPNAGKQHSL